MLRGIVTQRAIVRHHSRGPGEGTPGPHYQAGSNQTGVRVHLHLRVHPMSLAERKDGRHGRIKLSRPSGRREWSDFYGRTREKG